MSQLLRFNDASPRNSPQAEDESISTLDQETYSLNEDISLPIAFRIGNGGAGYTGLLKCLCLEFISSLPVRERGFRIAWVSNHSRHTQIGLLADVVQVALTYEPDNEEVSIREGWARRVGRGFNDHFIVVGPKKTAPSPIDSDRQRVEDVMRKIAGEKWLFHSRGDGSATFMKEKKLWRLAGVEIGEEQDGGKWLKTLPGTPYEALVGAERDGAFLITDRATFLTAKRDGLIPGLRVWVEGGEELFNPCAVMVWNYDYKENQCQRKENGMAERFAEWLTKEEAQRVVRDYGRHWALGKPLFTEAVKEEFDEVDRLGSGDKALRSKI